MRNEHGDFIWYELVTDDAPAATAFYSRIVGWRASPADASAAEGYQLFRADGPPVCGLLPLTQQMRASGARPGWLGYIGVSDVDATTEAVRHAGGAVLMPPVTMEGVGRLALVQDPQGLPFYIMRGAVDMPSQSFAQDAPRDGHCAWNELATPDPEGALAFYGSCFGWEVADSLDMGPIGAYRMLRNPPHRTLLGAVMKAQEAPPGWSFYMRVPDIDAAAAAITAQGGSLLMPPGEIPGGEFTLAARDPQGAAFALIGPRMA